MQLQERVDLLFRLGEYMQSTDEAWIETKHNASIENGWFIPEFIELSIKNIVSSFLQKNKLQKWAAQYHLPQENASPKNIGLIMAGNIPLVGFHDFLCAFISGHRQTIKPSSKDNVLIKHLVEKLFAYDEAARDLIFFSDMLKGCDAYIATGSNNSARYFEYYFNKYPHIIRRNRTSVAVLAGDESTEELGKLADDVYSYFGLGCRNVTKIYVPEDYDFVPLLESFKKYKPLFDHHKYRNNYDYQLAILIINSKYYMTDGAVILTENNSVFSPISVLHFEYYKNTGNVIGSLMGNADIQCIVGKNHIPFGQSQKPSLCDYADGADTMQFLCAL
jgi:acyl-CoA reductase LuxC